MTAIPTTILVYNTHLFIETRPVLRTILDDEERTEAIVAAIVDRQPGIVALCEVWADTWATRMVAALERYYPFHFRPVSREGFALSSGLLLLSQLPIRQAQFNPYYDTVDTHRADMGFITAAISRRDSHELTCRLILTHDKATFDDDIERYAAIRTHNRARILAIANEFSSDEVPLIVVGDLNVIGESGGDSTAEYQSMCEQYQSLGLMDMYRTMYPNPQLDQTLWGLTYSGSLNPLLEAFDGKKMARSEERLDYVWVSASTQPGWSKCAVERHAYEYHPCGTEVWPASDHYPLEATLEL